VVELSAEQKSRIERYLEKFKERFRHELSDEGWAKERRNREELFEGLLGKEHIFQLTEAEFRNVLASLWANAMWGNKNYPADRVLRRATIERVRDELSLLLWGDAPIAQRYDRFRNVIKGMGPSSITEILCFVRAGDYPIWNEKPKNVLPLLGMRPLLPDKVYKYDISGDEYARCIVVLDILRREVESHGFPGVDFMDLDILMWLLFSEVVAKPPKPAPPPPPPPIEPTKIDPRRVKHWDAVAMLAEIGNMLGHDIYVADPGRVSSLLDKRLGDLSQLTDVPPFTFAETLDTVRRIDIIWFDEEFPSYCFEVEDTTDVTRGLLRLWRLRKFLAAKFFIIGPSENQSRFESEVAGDPFRTIKDRYQFKSYVDLVRFYEEAKEYYEVSQAFLGDRVP